MARTKINPNSSELLPDPRIADRYQVTSRTIDRWDRQPELGFPRPIRINGRKYRYIHELETWERERIAAKRSPKSENVPAA
jgi:predicted DNA-binding transcriptional regulator AlpA